MSWQYCDMCGGELNPTERDFLVNVIECECGASNDVACAKDTQQDLIKGMFSDIQELKQTVEILENKVGILENKLDNQS